MFSWLTASWSDDRSTNDTAEYTRTTPSPPHDHDTASAGSSDSEGASLAGLPRESFDTLQSNASTISAPWFDHATPNHPIAVPKEGLPEATPWFSAATLDAPFPPPPPAPWFAEASMHSPVRVSSPTPAASSSQGYLDIPPANERKSGEDESDGSPPFFSAVATMKKPFRLRKSKKKVGNGNSAPKPKSFAPSESARRYPVSEYAANTDSDTESCFSTKSEPVNLRKLTSRASFGLFSLGLGLGARVQSIVPPPLPPRPPPPSSVATEDGDDDPDIETDADSSFASSSTYTAPSTTRSVGSLVKKESLIFYSQKPPSPPATPLPSRSEKIIRSAVDQIGDTTIMLSRLARSAKRTMEPSEAAEAIGRLTSVDAGAERSLLECVDRSVTRVEVFLQAVLPRAAAVFEKDAGSAIEGIVQREVDAESAAGDAPPAYTARAAEDMSLLPEDINVVPGDYIRTSIAADPRSCSEKPVGQPEDIVPAEAMFFAAEAHTHDNVEQASETTIVLPAEACDPVPPAAAASLAVANVAPSQEVEMATADVTAEMLTHTYQPMDADAVRAVDKEPEVIAEVKTDALAVSTEQAPHVAVGSVVLLGAELSQVVETHSDPAYTACEMSTCAHLPAVYGTTRAFGHEPALTFEVETHAPAVSTEQVQPVVVGNDKSITMDIKSVVAERSEGLHPVNVSADTAAPAPSMDAFLHSVTSPLSAARHLPIVAATSSEMAFDTDTPVTASAVAVPLDVDRHLPLARAAITQVQVEEPETRHSAPAAVPLSLDTHLPLAQLAVAEVSLEPIRAVETQSAASELSPDAHLPLARVSQREVDEELEGLIAEEALMAVAVPVERNVPLVAPLSLTRYLPSFVLERSDVAADAAMEICNLLSPPPVSPGNDAHVCAAETEFELPAANVVDVIAVKELASAARHLPVATAVHRQMTADRESRAQIFLTVDQPPTPLARHVPVAGANETEHEAQRESVSESLAAANCAPEVAVAQHPPVIRGMQREIGVDDDASVQALDWVCAPLELQTHLPCVTGMHSEHGADAGEIGLQVEAASEHVVAVHTPLAVAVSRSLDADLAATVAMFSEAATQLTGRLHLPAAAAKQIETSMDSGLTVDSQSVAEPRELAVLLPKEAAVAMHSEAAATQLSRCVPAAEAKKSNLTVPQSEAEPRELPTAATVLGELSTAAMLPEAVTRSLAAEGTSVVPELTIHAHNASKPRELPITVAASQEVSTAVMPSEAATELTVRAQDAIRAREFQTVGTAREASTAAMLSQAPTHLHLPAVAAKQVVLNVDSELIAHAQDATKPRELPKLAVLTEPGSLTMHSDGNLHFPAAVAKCSVLSVDGELTAHRQSVIEPREPSTEATVWHEANTAAILSEASMQLSRHLPAATAKHTILRVDPEQTVNAQISTPPRELAVLAGRHLPNAAASLREVSLESEALAVVLAASAVNRVNLRAYTPAASAARKSVEVDAVRVASKAILAESVSLAHHIPTMAAACTDLDINASALVTSHDTSMRTPMVLAQHRPTARATQYSLALDAPAVAEKTFSNDAVPVNRHFPTAAPIRTDVADFEEGTLAVYSAAPTAICVRTVWPTAATAVRNVDLDLARAVSPVPASMGAAVASAKGLAPVGTAKPASSLGAASILMSSLSHASLDKNTDVGISTRSVIPTEVVSEQQMERNVTRGHENATAFGISASSGIRTESALVSEQQTEPNVSNGELTADVFDQMFSAYFSSAAAQRPEAEKSVVIPVSDDIAHLTSQPVRDLSSTPSRPRKSSDRPEVASERARDESFSPSSHIPGAEENTSGPSMHPAADGDWASAAARRGTTVRSRSYTLNERLRPEPQPRTASDPDVIATSRSPAVRSRDRSGRSERSEANLSDASADGEVANRLRPFSISSADSTTAVVDGGHHRPMAVDADTTPARLSNDHLPERQALPLSPPVSPMHKRFHSISSAGMSAASRVDSGISDLSGMASPVVRSSVVTKGTDSERTAAAVAAAVPVFLHLSPAEAAAKGLEQEHQWSLAHHMRNVIISRAEIQASASAAPSHGTPLDLIAKASQPKTTFAGYLAARNRSASAVMQTIARKSGEVQRSFDAKRTLSFSRDVGKARTPTIDIVAPHANDHDYDIENASPVLSPAAEPAAHASMLQRSTDDDSDRGDPDDDEGDTTDWLQNFAAFTSVVAFALLVGILQAAPLLARGPVFGPNVSTFAAELPLAALLITAVGSSPVWAWAGGVVGSPAPLTACVALFTLFIGLSAGSTDWNALIALAACAGLFAGGILPLSLLAPEKKTTRTRHAAVSLVILVFAVVFGLTCGPIIGHALLLRGYDHWRWMFLIPALVALPGILFAAALLWKARTRKHGSGSTVDQSAPRMLDSLSSRRHLRQHRGSLGLGPAFLLAGLLTAAMCAILWGGQYPSFGGAQAGGGGSKAAQQTTAAGTPQSGLALDTSPNAHALHSPGWVQNANGQWTFAPGGIVPGGGAAPGGAAPGGTAPGGTTPAGTAPGGTTPAGTAPGGSAPAGTAPGGTAPGGTAPGGTAPAGTAPGGTAPGGTAPGGTAPGGVTPGGVTPGGAVPGGATPGGAVPGGATPPGTVPVGGVPAGTGPAGVPDGVPAGTAPGGVSPGGTAPGPAPPGTTPGGVAPPAGSSISPSGTAPTAAPAPYPSSLGPGADAPRNPKAILFQQLDQCRMPPSFNDLPGATSPGTPTDAPGPLLSKAAWAGLFSALVIIAIGTLAFLISSLFSGKHLAAVGTVIALAAAASGFAAFAAVARYPPLVIGTLACHPSAALTYVLAGAILACILMCLLPHSKESHARSALPGSVIALVGCVLVAIDIGDGISGIGFAVLCFGTIVATASGAKSRNRLIGALVGIGFGVLFANTAFRAHAASRLLPFTASPLDAQTADAIGDGLHLVHRAVAVPLAALAVIGWASFAALASRAH
ncbi:hypothetical protein HDU88_006396 [Geranomyces variabilis]|nr:hypothetical protein HDU88_006396 [Geranomyces variabilis]